MLKRLIFPLAVAILFWSCGGSNTPSASVPIETVNVPDSQPLVPQLPMRIVTLGNLTDPRLDALAQMAARVDQTPDPAVHDILVVDARTTPVGSNPTVQAFLQASKTVVVLHPTDDQKVTQLVPLSGMVARGPSEVFAVRRGTDRFGRSEFFLFEWPSQDVSDTPFFQLRFAEYALAASSTAGDSGFDPPAGLIYTTYNNYYTPPNPASWNQTAGGHYKYTTPQVASLVSNYTFRLFYNKGDQVTPDNQFVHAEADIRSSPFNPALGSDGMLDVRPGGFLRNCDMGWFQIALASKLQPQSSTDLRWLADSPANTNNVTTVTTGLTLRIGFLQPGRSLYQYSSSETRQLTSWLVNNLGGGATGSWQYYNEDPFQATDPSKWDQNGFGGGMEDWAGTEMRTPNALAMSELQCNTQIAWSTPQLLNTLETIDCELDVQYANAYVIDFGGGPKQDINPFSYPFSYVLDMAAVIPVPIQSITFAQNPVPASQGSVQGTVTLASPALINTTVFLTATNSTNNAAIQVSPITIPAGSSSANFTVLVNNNGLLPNQQVTSDITATTNETFNAQLQIVNQ